MMRLSGWARIGVVLSVLWVVGGGMWKRAHDLDEAVSVSIRESLACVEQSPSYPHNVTEQERRHCTDLSQQIQDDMLRDNWQHVAVFAFVPLIIG